jgi:hypothetical protein
MPLLCALLLCTHHAANPSKTVRSMTSRSQPSGDRARQSTKQLESIARRFRSQMQLNAGSKVYCPNVGRSKRVLAPWLSHTLQARPRCWLWRARPRCRCWCLCRACLRRSTLSPGGRTKNSRNGARVRSCTMQIYAAAHPGIKLWRGGCAHSEVVLHHVCRGNRLASRLFRRSGYTPPGGLGRTEHCSLVGFLARVATAASYCGDHWCHSQRQPRQVSATSQQALGE